MQKSDGWERTCTTFKIQGEDILNFLTVVAAEAEMDFMLHNKWELMDKLNL